MTKDEAISEAIEDGGLYDDQMRRDVLSQLWDEAINVKADLPKANDVPPVMRSGSLDELARTIISQLQDTMIDKELSETASPEAREIANFITTNHNNAVKTCISIVRANIR